MASPPPILCGFNSRQEKLLQCPQEGCMKVFRSNPGYRYHIKTHAANQQPHQCHLCQKKYKSANGLQYHLRKGHSIDPVTGRYVQPAAPVDSNLKLEFSCDEDRSITEQSNSSEDMSPEAPFSRPSFIHHPYNTPVIVQNDGNSYQMRCHSPDMKDINGNIDLTNHGKHIPKRRNSRPIPPALVIEPDLSSVEEKPKPRLHPDINRLTEFAEIATSPRSPLVHSPLPPSLTPALLDCGTTPDWLPKSPFTKFFFPDKSSPYLTTPSSLSCRYPGESKEGNDNKLYPSMAFSSFPAPTSFPSSPFIDNITTPLPFWPAQVWPTPVWNCFLEGCSLRFENSSTFEKIENIARLGTNLVDSSYGKLGFKMVDVKEGKVEDSKDSIVMQLESLVADQPKVLVKCPPDYPLYVKQKGWSSYRPQDSSIRYCLLIKALLLGDICVQPPTVKEKYGNSLSPFITSATVFSFNASETGIPTSQKRVDTTPKKIFFAASRAKSPVISEASPVDTLHIKKETPSHQPTHYDVNCNDTKNKINHQSTKELENSTKKRNPKKKRRKTEKPLTTNTASKRPMNGFMLFAKAKRVELTQMYPGKDNRAISVLLGESWKSLSAEDRQEFALSAKQMADERKLVNPDCWKRKKKKGTEDKIEKPKEKLKPSPSKKKKLDEGNPINHLHQKNLEIPSGRHLPTPHQSPYSLVKDLQSQTWT